MRSQFESSPFRLYEFRLSHFCEKARWALDFKGVPYESVVLLPGPHRFTVRRLTGATQVPVLQHGPAVVNGSGAIIDFLDRRFVDSPLTPADPQIRQEALRWEQRLDSCLGEAARRVFYHHALRSRRFIVPCYTQGGPGWGRAFYALALPYVVRAVRKMYNINERSVRADVDAIHRLFDELDQHFQTRAHLAGDHFTRADLTLAALAGPILRVEEYGATWPADPLWPPELRSAFEPLQQSHTASIIRGFYAAHRCSSRAHRVGALRIDSTQSAQSPA